MANSINVIQNKWAHITQLEGRSSRCTGPAATTASTGPPRWVRGAPCSCWGSVQLPPHWARAGSSCPEAVLQCYKWAGKANKGLCVAQVVHLAPACSVCGLQSTWSLLSHQGQAGVLIPRGALGQSTPSYYAWEGSFLLLGALSPTAHEKEGCGGYVRR